MKNLISAFGFLTILPLGRSDHFDPVAMIPWFPVVGLVVGLMLALFDMAAGSLWPTPVAAVLDVVFLAAVTGAFHLDGLGDAADGLFSHRPRDRALVIMKDSRVGIMGLVAVVCTLGIKWSGLATMDAHRFLGLIIVPAYARGGMLLGMKLLPYGRPEGGTGTEFFKTPLTLASFIWLAVPIGLSFFLGWRLVVLNGVFAVLVLATVFFYRRRMGCVTGDMLGAMSEFSEAVLFLALSLGGSA